jgi:hypothetical protein
MSAAITMCSVWLYTSKGVEALPQLAQALAIPVSHVVAGGDTQAEDLNHLSESGLKYFLVHGDFLLTCDVRLAGWTLPAVHTALQQLSFSGMRIAMLDDSSDNLFECELFESGNCRSVTVVENDETNEVTLYPAAGRTKPD